MPRRAWAWGVALASLLCAGAAQAGTFNVTNTNDSGAGSLRQALTDANASSDATDSIVFAAGLAGMQIGLATSLPTATGTLIFDATASPGVIVDGTNIPVVNGTRTILANGANANITFRGLSFQNGRVSLLSAPFTSDGANAASYGGDGTRSIAASGLTFVKAGAGTTTISQSLRSSGFGGTDGSATISGGILDVDAAFEIGSIGIDAGATFDAAGVNGVAVSSATARAVTTNSLTVHGTLIANSVFVGGVLSGTGGSIQSPVTVQNGGRIAPSGTTGTLGVVGPLTFESGSEYRVNFSSAGADRIDVSGGGGTLTLQPGARIGIAGSLSDVTAATTHTILTHSGARSGVFDLPDLAFFLEEALYGANQVDLRLTPDFGGVTGFAATPNQQAVASLLEAVQPGATGDLADVFAGISGATSPEVPDLLDAIGGEPLTAFATGRQILAERTARALVRRARDPSWGEGRALYADAAPLPVFASVQGPVPLPVFASAGAPRVQTGTAGGADASAPALPEPRLVRAGAWVDAFGHYGSLEGERGEAEVDSALFGATLGADVWLADQALLGLAVGYARSDLDLDGRDAELNGDTIQGAAYAGWSGRLGFVTGYGRYAYTFQESKRRIQVTGFRRVAEARWDAQDYSAGGEAGFTLLSLGPVALQPMAGIDWMRLTEERFRERRAGALALVVDPDDLETTTTRFGGRLFGRLDMGDGGELVPELRGYWQRQNGDRERVLTARLAGAPTGPITGVRGPEMPREVVILGAGWSASLGEALQVTLDYDALLDSDRVEHQGTIAARLRF